MERRGGTQRSLSPREGEVLRLIAGGLTNREIAKTLTIAPTTAARHVQNIFAKLGARVLEDALAAAASGDAQFVAVAGEPGIGKSRLLAEFGRRALAQDVVVLRGSCEEDGFVSFGPFAEALERHLAAHPPVWAESNVGHRRSTPETLFPRLVKGGPLLPAGSAEDARERLLRTMAELVALASAEQPLVLLLDDLHWADAQTLILLSHLTSRPGNEKRLIVGAYRDSELAWTSPLRDILDRDPASHSIRRLILSGFDQSEVRSLISGELRVSDAAAIEVKAQEIYARTDGNPFFALELAKHPSDHDPRAMPDFEHEPHAPDTVRAAFDRRLPSVTGDERPPRAGSSNGAHVHRGGRGSDEWTDNCATPG
ncbi:MAG: AAA family ATPase [Dehalococcoidia bacterium]|uniref:AAA family ATPase n=1 Tax=Candidatus Amarobacter glycogenicus TaxID=3140699 RepID=UPI0031350A5B|nr:AAA family ATPase [Dehalococcoidia bacterium]